MKHNATRRKTVLVTGANGYIGNAVANAFNRAGWKTYGLCRREADAAGLARNEIHPLIGSPEELSFLKQTEEAVFDVVVSNTEDFTAMASHLSKVKQMMAAIGEHGAKAGIRPLLMFTSGCKDYGGMDLKDGDAGLAPHTESSPMKAPDLLLPREQFGSALLVAEGAPYDATVLRPTIVYGLSSSHYGPLFDLASGSEGVLELLADPAAIMHSLHVDDCAEAYVMLAEHPQRREVAQQAFNISSQHYETAQQIGEALAHSYGLQLKLSAPIGTVPIETVHGLANFWQWVGSDKLRALTGWHERRATFTTGLEEYRLAYETRSRHQA
ncbi:NAD(P)-dependent oxidoreductase [Pantoea sp. BAV 3049]|uniref:NAD-dependent epimerase/dehydratase family protein n=1 Tax=Pantoea sp. BAV 3049 TaxID=2654188 RepID=UPI00131E3973|nr:NAD(P)-dependent oxidoreductase [Pantoea sp. BAV 3049]